MTNEKCLRNHSSPNLVTMSFHVADYIYANLFNYKYTNFACVDVVAQSLSNYVLNFYSVI